MRQDYVERIYCGEIENEAEGEKYWREVLARAEILFKAARGEGKC